MKASCPFATWFWIISISKNIWWIVSFVILYYFTSVMVTPSILLMLRCRKTSGFSRSETLIAQILHIHSRICMGVSRKIKYLLRSLTYIDKESKASLLSNIIHGKYYTTQNFQDIWSALLMWQKRMKLWHCLLHLIHRMLYPQIVSFVSRSIFSQVW